MSKKFAVITALLLCSACDQMVDAQMQDIKKKVATDAVSQYEMAARQGDKIQKCVHAGMVAAAYLQAEDEANYGTWMSIQKADCAAAGVPQ
jgi:hypothetical protein